MTDLLLEILKQTAIHTGYTLVCVAIGFVIGLSLGIGLSRLPRLSKYLLPLLSILNTIPGIVFIGMLVIWIGMQPATVIIALSIYAMFPVLKNTVAGLNGVDEQYKEAALGCGMNQLQSLRQVELPLALPTIIGGAAAVHRIHRQLDGAGRHDRPARPR